MILADLRSLVICDLLVLFIMSMIGIDLRSVSSFLLSSNYATYQVGKLSNLMSGSMSVLAQLPQLPRLLLMNQANFQIVKLCITELLAHIIEGMLQFVLEMLEIRPAIFWACGRHVGVVVNRRGSHAIIENLKREMLRRERNMNRKVFYPWMRTSRISLV